jgi:hypothetical protein
VKNFLLKFIVSFLLLSVSAEMVTGLWKDDVSLIALEKEKDNNNKGSEKEKDEAKDKILQLMSLQEKAKSNLSIFVLSHIYFTNLVYLSVPELPPDLV